MHSELPLAAKTLLLAYHLDKQRLTHRRFLGIVLRGAVLTELSAGGLLIDSDGKAKAVATSRPVDPVLAGAFDEISSSRPASWKNWVRRNARDTFGLVRDDLAARGVIEVESRRTLGVFQTDRITPTDPAAVQQLQRHVVDVLFGSTPVHEVDREDAALIGLAGAGELLRKHASIGELWKQRKRIKALAEHGGDAVPATKVVIDRIRAAAANA
ncbi:GPP34 family phosphoprotein [Saccharopolyspora erythraea]|uniref:GOLPH3/VPS74 family protein n=1 Tax=Saccharopolyspora erythraea TaxID=1836 RepID=UPI001BA53417|nr:GPP34 family phosphoprotein [Saccharopolyspora erythraea]QUH01975.1 GPP34 family phosphoprotein [Saccharopolyspora erythraea]